MRLIEAISPNATKYGTDQQVSDQTFDTIPEIAGMKVYYTFADMGSHRYMVTFTKVGNNVYDVGFSSLPIERGSVDWSDYLSLEPTNVGNALRVFGTIAYIIQEFSNSYPVNGFRFAASDDKRRKIYRKMVLSPSIQNFLASSGYNYTGPKEENLIMYGKVEYHYFMKNTLTESYEDDMYYQSEALKFYETVKNFMTGVDASIMENFKRGDKYVLTFGTFLFVITKADINLDAGFGYTQNGKPFIIVYLYHGDEISNDDIKSLVTHFRWKQKIIHEAIHLLDRKRYSKTFKNEYDMATVDAKKYFNVPSEINSHFHELLTFVNEVEDWEPIIKRYPTVGALTDYLYSSRFITIDKYISDDTRKRLKKRIAKVAENIIQS